MNVQSPLSFPARLFRVLVAINLLLVGFHLITQFGLIESGTIRRLVHLNGEANPPAWYSGALLGLIALTSALIALQQRQSAGPSPWRLYLLVAAGFCFLSLDEVGMVHEAVNEMLYRRVGAASGWLSDKHNVGLMTYLAYCVIALALLVGRRREVAPALADPRGRWWIVGGAVCFFTGAVLVDALGGMSAWEFWLEEFMEFTGVGMILCGFVARLGPQLVLQIEPVARVRPTKGETQRVTATVNAAATPTVAKPVVKRTLP